MPKPNPRTQALLDEQRAPSHARRADVAAAAETFFGVLELAGAQALRGRSLLNLARVAETDPSVAGKFEELQNSYGAMQRISGEIERLVGDLLKAFEQVERTDAEMRPLARKGGYTT